MNAVLVRRLRSIRSTAPITSAGVLVMVVAGVAAHRYAPMWFDPDEGCRLLGRCVTPASEARRSAWNQVHWGGFAVVLIGLALTCGRLPAVRRSAPPFPLPAWGHAAAAGLVGMALTAVLAPVALVGAIVVIDAAPAVLCVVWLVQARVLVALDRRVGIDRPRRGWLTAHVAAAVGVGATVWLTVQMLGPWSLLLSSVVDGAALAAVVLIGRVLPARSGVLDAPPRVGAAAGLAGLAVVSAVALTVAGTRPAGPPASAALGPPPAPSAPPPAPEPAPVAPHADVPAPPVDADAACAPGVLTWSTAGWDAAMGTRAVTVIATHRGTRACYVDGFAEIALAQGGRPLQLVVTPGSAADPSAEAVARRVGIAPGGTASFALSWQGSGAAADQDTPQLLTVSLPGAGASEVPLSRGPAPFDVRDGAQLRVGPWRPGQP